MKFIHSQSVMKVLLGIFRQTSLSTLSEATTQVEFLPYPGLPFEAPLPT